MNLPESGHRWEVRYDRIAGTYDQDRFIGPLESRMIQHLVGVTDARKGQQVLDAATGTGRIAIPLAQLGLSAYAIDITRPMLEKIGSKCTSGPASPRCVQGSVRYLPFPNDTFDLVVCFRFMHLFGVEEQIAFVEELHRVAKPGGQVLVEFNNANSFWVGGIFQDCWRILKGQKPLQRIKSIDLQEIYQSHSLIAREGFSFPFMGMVTRVSLRLADILLSLSTDKLVSLSRFTWILSQKIVPPDGDA